MEYESSDLGLGMNMEKTVGRATGFPKYTFPEHVRGAALGLDDLAKQPFAGMPSSHGATNSQGKKLGRVWKKVEQSELRAAAVCQTMLLCQKSPTYLYQQTLLNKSVKKLPDWEI